jgi:hypothetical protein
MKYRRVKHGKEESPGIKPGNQGANTAGETRREKEKKARQANAEK